MRRAASLAVVGLALAFGPSGCGPGEGARPSVLLVTLDTTRWDHLGTYGDPAARTPVFDALARRGVLYRNAFVDSPTTLPSHTTMLTGAISLRHGVRLNDAFALADEARTLPELFAEAGYATAAVVSSTTLAADRGLDQGFDLYDDTMPPAFESHDPRLRERTKRFAGAQRRADQTTAAAVRALSNVKSPAFLWIHYVDAHLTYDPPPPWDRVPLLSPYAGEIAFADREMGRMLRTAASLPGAWVVAVVSDHGEGLGDHREDEHGMFLYDSTVRVPFVLAGPNGHRGTIDSAPVINADVAPTLLAAAGVSGGRFPDGRALGAPARRDDERPSVLAETITPTRFHGGSPLKALRVGGWKYVLAPEPELYDLDTDPGERHDLLDEGTPRADELRRRLVRFVEDLDPGADNSLAAPASVDASRREALLALGYLGAGRDVPAIVETEAVGIDSKDLIDVTRSVRYVMDGRYDEARPRLERFWRTHPTVPDSSWHELFSRAHLAQAFLELTDLSQAAGHAARARKHLSAALRFDPSYEHARSLEQRLDELEGR